MSELLPINPSLYDPALQYSDQYMPLAMMPAIVEAIQNGGGGGGGAGLFVVTWADGHTDKTFNEIKTAVNSGNIVQLYYAYDTTKYYYLLTSIKDSEGDYTCYFEGYGTLATTDPDDTMVLLD